ncbi:MAG: hydroxymethylbilane synthase [Chlamydiales bacterium]|nr:hydroxymethylbilane synthase [Chlamydiales bacterium]
MPWLAEEKNKIKLRVGARASKLSQIQIEEVLELLQSYHSDTSIEFSKDLIHTTGDKDLSSSLMEMDKTDFFTREIDKALLDGQIDIAIHSAKDLPDPLHQDLDILALTKGQDPRDSILLPDGESIESLKSNSRVACSSHKRRNEIKLIKQDLCFVDVRGCVESRIQQMKAGAFDALVVAEAALIRLNLTHLHRHILSYPTTKFQGQLAILAKKQSTMLKHLFLPIDSRE